MTAHDASRVFCRGGGGREKTGAQGGETEAQIETQVNSSTPWLLTYPIVQVLPQHLERLVQIGGREVTLFSFPFGHRTIPTAVNSRRNQTNKQTKTASAKREKKRQTRKVVRLAKPKVK